MADDKTFLLEAVRLSLENIKSGEGGPFGAVVVKDGKIIGRGANKVTSSNDPTAHAEVMAIRNACKNLDDFKLDGAIMYTSCEPCPMCLSAIYWARIDKIIFANTRQEAAAIGFDDDLIYKEIPKDLSDRIIPISQLKLEEALSVFNTWSALDDKTEY